MKTFAFRRHNGAFPKPDRSNVNRRFAPDEYTGEMDLGWAEGNFSDGRPYRVESWCWRHLKAVTFFLSRTGLEGKTAEELVSLLAREVALRITGTKSVTAEKTQDASGNDLWSVCVIVRHEDETWAETGLAFRPYEEALSEAAAECLARSALWPQSSKL